MLTYKAVPTLHSSRNRKGQLRAKHSTTPPPFPTPLTRLPFDVRAMSLSRPRHWEGNDDGDEGSRRSPPAKRPRCGCCQATRDFYEKRMEQRMEQELASIRREMQELYKKIYPDFSEMSKCNQRKQQDGVTLTAEISRSGGYVQQSPGPRVSSDQNCIVTLRLQFENSCSTDKFSTHEIKADDGTPLKVAIYDNNNRIITIEPFSSMRVHIVAIHGDFDDDHKGQWTDDYFRSKIVLGRPRKEHLLSEKLYFRLQNGVGYLNGVKFQDNSSFVPSKRFKLAVMAEDQRIMERIQEGITESFAVKDVRGYSLQKNSYPSPSDPVHKLTRITINGKRYKALENNKIKTVEDFLCSYTKDEKKLRKVLGNISDHDWNIIVEHAHRCNQRKENYSQCIQERNMCEEQEPNFRNSSQPNTSDQHVMPYEHLRVILTNQQISSTENEFLPVSSIDNTLKGSTSLQPDSLECNIVHDGNEIPSTSVENILDGSISMQDNLLEHGTMLHDGLPHRPRATSWKKIVTTVIFHLKKNQGCAAVSPSTMPPSNDPVDWRIQSSWNDRDLMDLLDGFPFDI